MGEPRRWKWSTARYLRSAGWEPGRDVGICTDVLGEPNVFPAARSVLREFCGIRLGTKNEYLHVEPSYGARVESQIKSFEAKLRKRLLVIGVIMHQDREYVVLDEDGSAYMLYVGAAQNDTQLITWALTFDSAIEFFVQSHLRGNARFREKERTRPIQEWDLLEDEGPIGPVEQNS